MTDRPASHDYRAPVPEEHKLQLQAAASEIARRFPGLGFALLVFDFQDQPGGLLTYISNAQRPDIVKTMQEWIARQSS